MSQLDNIENMLKGLSEHLGYNPDGTPVEPPVEPPVSEYRLLSNHHSKYKLTTPYPNPKNTKKPLEIFDLENYEDPLYKRENGVIKVACPWYGVTTSGKAGGVREEYRGIDTNEFSHEEKVELITTYQLDEMLQINDRKVVTQQFHDGDNAFVKRVNRWKDGKIQCYYLIKAADGDKNDLPKIEMGEYDLMQKVKANLKYDGENQMVHMQDNDGPVKSVKVNRKGTGGLFYPKFLLYTQYKKDDEINHRDDRCRATFWI